MDSLSKTFLHFVFLSLLLPFTHGFPSHPHPHLRSHWLKQYTQDVQQNDMSNTTKNDLKTHYYLQTIDHFSYRPESYKKFKQRYLMNDKYWGGPKNNSPLFVYLGAESDIDGDTGAVGILHSLAPRFKALIVFLEHRFYGKSNPVGSMVDSMDDKERRGYFNSAQALADYAEIILYLKKQLKAEHSPVIVFGGSYGGMLAAWFRLKYPHVAHGALSSSGPILMNIKSPFTYTNVVAKDFRETSKTCHDTIKQSWSAINRLGATKPNGLLILTKKFKLCNTLKNSSDVKSLKDWLINLYDNAAQYDAPPNYPVSMICKAVDGAPKNVDIVDKIFAGFEQVAPFDQKKNCYQLPGSDEQSQLATEAALPFDTTIGWTWQTCTELANPTDGVLNNSMLEPQAWPTKDNIDLCKAFEARGRFNWIETYYGGKDIKLVLKNFGSNIIFYNGLRDPYSGYSILESLSDTLLAINAPKGSHCLDLGIPARTDPKWLVTLRNKEAGIIKDWLAKYYSDLAASVKG